jgi:hypothetical protein
MNKAKKKRENAGAPRCAILGPPPRTQRVSPAHLIQKGQVMKKKVRSTGKAEPEDSLVEMLHINVNGAKYGLNKLDYRDIIRWSLESNRFQYASIPAVANGCFAEEPVCGAIVDLAELIHDKASFHAFWGALCALVPDLEIHAYCEWPTKVGAGFSTAKKLKQYILEYSGDLEQHPDAPNMLLALFLADVVFLALIERERQLMAVKNGSTLLKRIG